ncbi:MAG: glycosyltransferase family 4 protein [Pseudomonadales bacterium]
MNVSPPDPALRHLLLVTDAWAPQTNGVVTTLRTVLEHLPGLGIETTVVHPYLFRTMPLPGYPEIPVVVNPWRLKALLREARPDAVHIATEGSLGLMARRLLVRGGQAFTTSLHTKFPEYFHARLGTPLSAGYRFLRWFHNAAALTLCTTASHGEELARHGLERLLIWGRGVDTRRFRPLEGTDRPKARPRLLYVGRVSVEKNIEAFLELDLDADKVVVGDGPARAELERRYPDAQWLGFRKGEALVREYAAADAFVFPSLTDTFGLVMLEANACGTPVAAYPVTGPKDVVVNGVNGMLDDDLEHAVRRALLVSRDSCRRFALANGWQGIAERFVLAMVRLDGTPLIAAAKPEPDNVAPWRHGIPMSF